MPTTWKLAFECQRMLLVLLLPAVGVAQWRRGRANYLEEIGSVLLFHWLGLDGLQRWRDCCGSNFRLTWLGRRERFHQRVQQPCQEGRGV